MSPGSRAVRRVVRLPAGTLELEVHHAELPLDELAGFAARRNAKRGFLFVSKVLGKHYPVRPRVMAEVHARLAAGVPADLPGPIVVIALAETAIGLGQSVYEEYRQATGREDTVFLHTTRYRVGQGDHLVFTEAHSHAPRQLLHVPVAAREHGLFAGARSLILVDDEITTGRTFAELVRAYRGYNPALSRVTLVCLTDWMGPGRRRELEESLAPLHVSGVSLLRGEYEFRASAEVPVAGPPNEAAVVRHKDELLPREWGRRGVCEPPELPAEVRACAPGLAAELAGRRLLVAGTGEFLYLPFRFARLLEARGVDVTFQSSTRSPIQLGHDIGAALEFEDNYFEEISNYLYNVSPGQYDAVIVCYETAALPPGHDLPAQLRARVLSFV